MFERFENLCAWSSSCWGCSNFILSLQLRKCKCTNINRMKSYRSDTKSETHNHRTHTPFTVWIQWCVYSFSEREKEIIATNKLYCAVYVLYYLQRYLYNSNRMCAHVAKREGRTKRNEKCAHTYIRTCWERCDCLLLEWCDITITEMLSNAWASKQVCECIYTVIWMERMSRIYVQQEETEW